MNIKDIYTALDRRAPFGDAEEWDNVGILIGNGEDEVSRILIALDATEATLDAAICMGVDLVVTHHPIIFDPMRSLSSNSLPYRFAAAGIGVLSAHTNLDKACGGVNDTLASLIGLHNVRTAPDGMCRIGDLPHQITAKMLAEAVSGTLSTAARVNLPAKSVRTVAVCGGGGGDFIAELSPLADAYVTGEIRHHGWLTAGQAGLAVIEAGHHATEQPVIHAMLAWLREDVPDIPATILTTDAPYITVNKE